MTDTFSTFAATIRDQKYAHDKPDGTKETWAEIAFRVAKHVLRAVNAPQSQVKATAKLIEERKFIPGGRYLYASGRPFHQVQNCLLFRAEDSREGWADLMQKATLGLMTGAGIGVVYSDLRAEGKKIRGTGGFSTGPLSLMEMVNEAGRGIMQGGSRRAAIWAGLHWNHPDAHKFIHLKDWIPEVRALKLKDFNFPATMDMTNISIILDDEFFKAYHNEKHSRHSQAYSVYWDAVKQMRKTGEPGFSIDTGVNNRENLRNACQPAYATVLTPQGISTIGDVRIGDVIWSGFEWTPILNKWSTGIKPVYKYRTTTGVFIGTEDHRVVSANEKIEVKDAETIDLALGVAAKAQKLDPQDIMDGLVLGDGTVHKASNNLVLLCIGSKDQDYFNSEIAHLILKSRPGVSPGMHEIQTTITAAELPKTFQRTVPERFYFGSNKKKIGFLRGLFTANGSVSGNRVCLKQASRVLISEVQEMLSSLGIHSYVTTNKGKAIAFSNGTYQCKESYDLNITNGRTIFKDCIGFIQGYKNEKVIPGSPLVHKTSAVKSVEFLEETEVFDLTVKADTHTYWTGGLLVSNCTELTSEDDSDICNLGSVNLSRIESLDEMKNVVELATKFLLAGTLYSDVPFPKVDQVRTRNRRIGLGLMGIHEWLLTNRLYYAPNAILQQYLEIYATSGEIADKYADELDVSRPKKTRAIAPTGSIGILAETTTGIEPLFCAAYKRRYLKHRTWNYQYVVDPTAARLVEQGVDPDHIEDAYSIDEERRVAFQAWVQQYVDHAISSTINLPPWGSESNNESTVQPFGEMLLKYLPKLRGLTCYPDGSRGGQPLTPVKFATAVKHIGQIYIESTEVDFIDFNAHREAPEYEPEMSDDDAARPMNVCDITKGGECGS